VSSDVRSKPQSENNQGNSKYVQKNVDGDSAGAVGAGSLSVQREDGRVGLLGIERDSHCPGYSR
jgi:hypothetical protein